MACTVTQLAKLSGVTVRTLHFYDEIGLLKPAHTGANGYRFYEEAQLLRLQQILFYRELGFDLERIRSVLGKGDFDRIAALQSHRKSLVQEKERTEKLIRTIDRTLRHLKGTTRMKDREMYQGFDPKKQAEHERYLVDRYGGEMKSAIAASRRRIKDWTREDWERVNGEFGAICQDLVRLRREGRAPGSTEVQKVIRRHYEWLKRFWIPTRESYSGHSQLIVDSELRHAYDAHDPQLADFIAEGIRLFAERELT